jgi:hypothetical protein
MGGGDLPELFKNDSEVGAAFMALERLYLDWEEKNIHRNEFTPK